jgi:hypothetical protein
MIPRGAADQISGKFRRTDEPGLAPLRIGSWPKIVSHFHVKGFVVGTFPPLAQAFSVSALAITLLLAAANLDVREFPSPRPGNFSNIDTETRIAGGRERHTTDPWIIMTSFRERPLRDSRDLAQLLASPVCWSNCMCLYVDWHPYLFHASSPNNSTISISAKFHA